MSFLLNFSIPKVIARLKYRVIFKNKQDKPNMDSSCSNKNNNNNLNPPNNSNNLTFINEKVVICKFSDVKQDSIFRYEHKYWKKVGGMTAVERVSGNVTRGLRYFQSEKVGAFVSSLKDDTVMATKSLTVQ